MRARNLIAAAVVTSTAAVALTAATPPPADAADPWVPNLRTSAPDEPPRLELRTELAKMPAEMPVFAVAADEISAAEVAGTTLAAVTDSPLLEADGTRVLFTDGEAGEKATMVAFAASDAFDYRTASRFQNPPEDGPRLPSDREAVKMAVELLDDIATTVTDEEVSAAVVTHSTMTQRDAEKGADVRTIQTDVEVRFPQLVETELGPVRVTGPGSKLYVAFGDGGDLVGLTRTRMALEHDGTVLETIQPRDAVDLLARGGGVLDLPRDCARAAVVDVEPVYWVGTPRVEQRGAVPLYELDLRCTSAKGEDLGVHAAYAPAVLGGGEFVDDGLDGPDGEQPPAER